MNQKRILDWAVATFGSHARNRDERAARVLEEALELAQASKVPIEVVDKLVNRVFSRESGDVRGELGQLQMTVMAFAENEKLVADTEAEIEFVRVSQWPKSHWARKYAAKVQDGIAAFSSIEKTEP